MDNNYFSQMVIPRHIICGPHNPLFFKYANLIKAAIEKMKLVPVAQSKTNPSSAIKVEMIPQWWKYGGMKIAHLHYQDQVYMLNNEQWRSFSKNLLESFSKNLEQANAVSFENALGICDALESTL